MVQNWTRTRGALCVFEYVSTGHLVSTGIVLYTGIQARCPPCALRPQKSVPREGQKTFDPHQTCLSTLSEGSVNNTMHWSDFLSFYASSFLVPLFPMFMFLFSSFLSGTRGLLLFLTFHFSILVCMPSFPQRAVFQRRGCLIF